MYFGPLVNDQSVTYLSFLGWIHLAHRSDKTFGFQMHSWWELATNFVTMHVFVEKCWFVKSKCFTDASLLWCIFSELQEGFCFWDLFQIELPWVGKSSRVCLEKWAQRDAIFSILWKWPIWLAQIMWQQCVESCGARSHWGDIQLLSFRSKVSESWICVFFFFSQIWKFHIPIELHTFVRNRRTAVFRPGVFLRAFPSSGESGNAAFKNWIPQAEEGNKSEYIFGMENKKKPNVFKFWGT